MIDYAIQPKSWDNFDPYGCVWVKNVPHAKKISKAVFPEESVTIWACPHKGNAYRLMHS